MTGPDPEIWTELSAIAAEVHEILRASESVGIREVEPSERLFTQPLPELGGPGARGPVAGPPSGSRSGPRPRTGTGNPAPRFQAQKRDRPRPDRGLREERRADRPPSFRSAGPPLAGPAPTPAHQAWEGLELDEDADAALHRVRTDLGECTRCRLAETRRHIVFGEGSAQAALVVVGEAPGGQEDKTGRPFVGKAGEMLTRMLENVLGLGRDQVYIMNVLKCRPPENRDPRSDEIRSCRPFFDAQLDVLDPRAILALGSFATRSLLSSQRGIKASRGRWGDYRGIPVMPTYHPAYLLRSPSGKRETWQDLLAVKRLLEGGDGGG